MAVDPRITRARELRRKGKTLAEVAGALNVSRATILRWTNDELAERDRAVSRAWKARNPEARAKHEKAQTGVCVSCGAPTTRKRPQCRRCSLEERAAQGAKTRNRIASLWRDTDMTAKQIAAVVGTTEGTVFVQLSRMRSEGVDIPHRQERRRGPAPK